MPRISLRWLAEIDGQDAVAVNRKQTSRIPTLLSRRVACATCSIMSRIAGCRRLRFLCIVHCRSRFDDNHGRRPSSRLDARVHDKRLPRTVPSFVHMFILVTMKRRRTEGRDYSCPSFVILGCFEFCCLRSSWRGLARPFFCFFIALSLTNGIPDQHLLSTSAAFHLNDGFLSAR